MAVVVDRVYVPEMDELSYRPTRPDVVVATPKNTAFTRVRNGIIKPDASAYCDLTSVCIPICALRFLFWEIKAGH